MRGFDEIGVVVPAKNEERLLPACLAALEVAARRVGLPVTVAVVLDACNDNSAGVVEAVARHAADIAIEPVVIDANNVGEARRQGLRTILDRRTRNLERLWLASTDADSVVPPRWLQAQLAHAADGALVVVGTVTVTAWEERSAALRDRAIADYANQRRHVHGANLSFAASEYVAAGEFPAQLFNEDVALVAAFGQAVEPVAWALDMPVATSARRQSRAPSGFANYLNELESEMAR